jgi:hypothetical protein
MDNIYLSLRMHRWQGRIASATSRLWPCISPFLMREPMEIALSAPPRARVRHRFTRRLIEHLNPRLARLPLAQGYPALPLRPGTALRFWPLVTENWQKVASRLRPPASGPASSANPLKSLTQNAEVRELLDPAHMRSSYLYDPKPLKNFLEQASQNGFDQPHHFGRVLTLEMTSRVIS